MKPLTSTSHFFVGFIFRNNLLITTTSLLDKLRDLRNVTDEQFRSFVNSNFFDFLDVLINRKLLQIYCCFNLYEFVTICVHIASNLVVTYDLKWFQNLYSSVAEPLFYYAPISPLKILLSPLIDILGHSIYKKLRT